MSGLAAYMPVPEPRERVVIVEPPPKAAEWAEATCYGDPTKIRGHWGWVERYHVCGAWAYVRVIFATPAEAEAAEENLRMLMRKGERERLEHRLAEIRNETARIKLQLAMIDQVREQESITPPTP